MKRIYTSLFIVMVFLFAGKAISQGTTFIVFTEKGEKFTVFVGGDEKNAKPSDHVTVDGLVGPTFKVRIVFQDNKIPEVSKTIFNKPGATMYYVLHPGKKDSYVLEHTTSDYVHHDEAVKEETPPPPPPSETKKQEKQGDKKTESSATSSSGGCTGPMPEGDFQASVVMISNAPFEGTKTSQAKKLVESHCLYCRQITEAMYVVSYESSRLSIAKAAYKHCFDPENYDEVKNALNTDKAKNDLEKYIQSAK